MSKREREQLERFMQMNEDEKERLERFMSLPIESHLFPTPAGEETELGVTVIPGSVEMSINFIDGGSGEVIEITGQPIRTIRRDSGEFRLCVEIKVHKPDSHAGAIGELWFEGDGGDGVNLATPGFVRFREDNSE